jgi:hypothetical protein
MIKMITNKKFWGFTFFALLFIVLGIMAFLGFFTPNYSAQIFIPAGFINRPFSDNTDYQAEIKYTSDGAFISGRKIDVNIKLNLLNKAYNNSEFQIQFPSAYYYPFKEGFQNIMPPFVILKYSENFTYIGDVKLIYHTSQDIDFRILINGNPQIGAAAYILGKGQNWILEFNEPFSDYNYIFTPPSKIHIAPLEESLQVENNKYVLALTLVLVGFTIFQIYLSYREK